MIVAEHFCCPEAPVCLPVIYEIALYAKWGQTLNPLILF